MCTQGFGPHSDYLVKNPKMFPALFNDLSEATLSGIIIPLAYVWRRETPKPFFSLQYCGTRQSVT